MNKKFAAIGVMALTLTTCSTPSQAYEQKPTVSKVVTAPSFMNSLKELEIKAKISMNTNKLNSAISHLKKYVGKTWYVFSGNTPRGWDCSGLTMWTYEQLGIELKHSASVQKNSGIKHKTPKIGDIVAFGWKGWSGAAHVGIYIGNGKMIHAPSPGHRTMVENIAKFAKYGYSKVTYTRIVQTN
ncbi:outer membrane lipoprotein [uncultured Caudovirales phage]|uniref:Outer membrane lipoprotein n=1 Tax=uncultured Caudovirales phage TaxID=2100421 RepID=A0A6J5TBR2_9CAUD|nr:outer membrane lipoprotein [uncultured Caudovirales phage]CAB5219089.1 outer membrane lipoprotein [uncultured Caudovirales phage]